MSLEIQHYHTVSYWKQQIVKSNVQEIFIPIIYKYRSQKVWCNVFFFCSHLIIFQKILNNTIGHSFDNKSGIKFHSIFATRNDQCSVLSGSLQLLYWIYYVGVFIMVLLWAFVSLITIKHLSASYIKATFSWSLSFLSLCFEGMKKPILTVYTWRCHFRKFIWTIDNC